MSEDKKRFTVEVKEQEAPTPKELPSRRTIPDQPIPKPAKPEPPWYEDTDTIILVIAAIILLLIAFTIIPFVPPPP
jgi:hypothetical protein